MKYMCRISLITLSPQAIVTNQKIATYKHNLF